jgi:SAM-dependent methyltransferase
VSATAGVLKIVRYNWPWYALALAAAVGTLLVLAAARPPAPVAAALSAGLLAAGWWACASLAVSHYVYDASPVARAAWLDGVPPGSVRRAAAFHAGEDEASAALAARFPDAERAVYDFFDPERASTPSLLRARALAAGAAAAVASSALPLADASLDLACVVFAAHELRADADRAAFFRELGRVLRPEGRVLVVEHLRDAWNAAAYGPGALHFLPRGRWSRTFAAAGLALKKESRCTPFVAVFELGRGA